MAQQTAVEWLVMTYHQRQGYIRFEDIEKAKAMEKEQIKKTIYNTIIGSNNIYNKYHPELEIVAEQYYNETYKK